MENFKVFNKYDLMFLVGILIIGLSGNRIFDDYVLQQEINCASATYVADNPGECKRVGE